MAERSCKKCFHYKACKEVASHSGYGDIYYTESQSKNFISADDVVQAVRCKDCKHNADNGGDCDRVLIHTHRNLITETNEYQYFQLNYCEYGTPKERGVEKDDG